MMDQKIMAERVVKEIPPNYHLLNPSRPVRVCAYVRVSTSHTGQLDSLQNQTAFYNSKFANHQGYTFLGVYSDAGISGAKETRPGFQAMLVKARAGELDLIYTKSISRFARNTLMLPSVVRELKAIGVGVIFEEQNINTLRSEGELMLTILAGIAEEEGKSVRTNIQWSMRSRFLRGEVMVDTNRLIGYGKDESGRLIIIPKQAEIVEQLHKRHRFKVVIRTQSKASQRISN